MKFLKKFILINSLIIIILTLNGCNLESDNMKDINIYTTYWKTELITNDITNLKRNIYNYKAMGQEELATKEQTTVDKLIELLKNDDFNRIY